MASEIEPAVTAIRTGRQLLDEPDPIAPLLKQVAAALRTEVLQRAEDLASAQRAAVEELEAWPDWAQLDVADREAILKDAKLVPVPSPDVASDASLLDALDQTSLSAWQDRISLVAHQRDQARQRAAKQLEPESVSVAVPSATIKTGEDLDRYVDELRARVQPHLAAGKTVII